MLPNRKGRGAVGATPKPHKTKSTPKVTRPRKACVVTERDAPATCLGCGAEYIVELHVTSNPLRFGCEQCCCGGCGWSVA